MKWFNLNEWHFRENKVRKKGKSKNGGHPSLVVGEEGNNYANLGLTSNPKRGHHKNIELSKNPNPNSKEKSYIRNDLELHDKKHLRNVLKDYRLSNKDINKIMRIINKKR